MISGEEIRAARERAGLTQTELANQLGVSLRSVGNWERGEHPPRNREAAIRAILAGFMDDSPRAAPVRIEHVSDMELIAELARRLAQRNEQASGRSTATVEELGRSMASYESPVERFGRETKEQLDQENYRLAADTGQEGVEPDDLPNET
ncbi:hypothetical protein C6401_10840 [Arthrobacter woluwensis]|uniref:helix-turn-helix domain-containing protein n=1 Tax=Arthrobacter woluwensis TaxID=156980 RepID=UPI000D11BA4F|nr:helix-turn-helix transcriptional regulator [Arthrobacter woluwensis]PSS43621.1 hypothetical protein C6401_10840 [Arthrobacter woluwensis]